MSELQTPFSALIYALLCDRVVKIGNKMRRQVAKFTNKNLTKKLFMCFFQKVSLELN